MNPALSQLQPYPFERLRRLFNGVKTPADKAPIALSIGEPQHVAPEFVREELVAQLDKLSRYPTTRGIDALRQSISSWLTRRFELPAGSIDPDRHVLPVNGTREALFAIAQLLVDRTTEQPLVLMPNPFYQIYEGAALLAGAQPWLLPTTAETGFIPDWRAVPDDVWARTQLIYVCSPGNPAGAVVSQTDYRLLLDLADEHDFVIAADECYSEIYPEGGTPPTGLLQACAHSGRTDYRRALVFHSLSKRSNLPGLRSGFVAGDAALIEAFFAYRTYHGCAMPVQHQMASALAWSDEAHVQDNRARYSEKFAAVGQILAPYTDCPQPAGGFYLWPQLPIDDQQFARGLYEREHVTVLPGSFLSRTQDDGRCPGEKYVRIALVAELPKCIEAAERIAHYWSTL